MILVFKVLMTRTRTKTLQKCTRRKNVSINWKQIFLRETFKWRGKGSNCMRHARRLSIKLAHECSLISHLAWDEWHIVVLFCMYTSFKFQWYREYIVEYLSWKVFDLQFLCLINFVRVLLVQLITLGGLTTTQIKTKIALKKGHFVFFCFCQVKKDFESWKSLEKLIWLSSQE